jgi:hypothetical protein
LDSSLEPVDPEGLPWRTRQLILRALHAPSAGFAAEASAFIAAHRDLPKLERWTLCRALEAAGLGALFGAKTQALNLELAATLNAYPHARSSLLALAAKSLG